MILFVDETENDRFFIVTGLLMKSKSEADELYRRFKKKINGSKISEKEKRVVYNEFKSTLLDKSYQRIKTVLLCEIMEYEDSIVYSCYIKKDKRMNQKTKEENYIALLSNIVSRVADVEIIYDTFNKRDFESKIEQKIGSMEKVVSISAKDSCAEPGLQLVDNLCSVIRLHRSNMDQNCFYDIIKNRVIEV